jgi:S1-C subfamily serine protease
VVAFDTARDIAVLRVPGLTAPALRLVPGAQRTNAAVYGHPGGRRLRVAPARVGQRFVAVGTDIYRTSESSRHVYVIGAELLPGDSGAALVNRRGEVIGMAFAIDPARDRIAYAVTDEEIRPVLDAVSPVPVDTRECLV